MHVRRDVDLSMIKCIVLSKYDNSEHTLFL